jgi:hypothetical protein
VGRLISPMIGGDFYVCTATIVGKRHIISASHCGIWHNLTDDSGPEPMIFQPGYNFGPVYPESQVIHSYWYKKVTGEVGDIGSNKGGDWLVGVLDREIESTNGKFGQELVYNSGWNGLDLWDGLGYPIDFDKHAEQQVYQGPMAVVTAMNGQYGELYYMEGVATTGSSGGPLYGIYKNLPQIIGTIAGPVNQFGMVVHGGPQMFDLIAKALAEYP